MTSITDNRKSFHAGKLSESGTVVPDTLPVAAGGSLLDINRETRSPRGSQSSPNTPKHKQTEKVTPALEFSDSDKQAWRADKVKETEQRSRAALSIAREYVNSADKGSKERLHRLRLFGSFLKCNKKKFAPVDLLQFPDGRLSVAGVWRCRSKWICPDCSSRLMYSEALRLRSLLEAIQRENERRDIQHQDKQNKGEEGCRSRLVVLFVTLTAPHKPGDGLREQMEVFSRCFSNTLHSTSLRKQRDKLGFVGSVRCFDHTVKLVDGLRDWHSHLHVMLVLDTPLITGDDSPALVEFADKLYKGWAARVEAAYNNTRKASPKAFCVEFVKLYSDGEQDPLALADYAAKICALPGYLTKSAKQKLQDGERVGGLSPADLLDLYSETESAEYAECWIEYCSGTKGFHRIDFSSGLLARFGLQNEEQKATARYILPPPVAVVALRSPVLMDGIKRCIVTGDVEQLQKLLAPHFLEGYAWDVCSPVDFREELIPDDVLNRLEQASIREQAAKYECKNPYRVPDPKVLAMWGLTRDDIIKV